MMNGLMQIHSVQRPPNKIFGLTGPLTCRKLTIDKKFRPRSACVDCSG